MTHEVVPADIEYAQRLLHAGYQDDGIIAALCWRGVAEQEAIELVQALRQGRTVRLTLPSGARLVPRDRIPAAQPVSNTSSQRRIRRTRHRLANNNSGGNAGYEFQAVVLFLAIIFGLVWVLTTDLGTLPGREQSNSAPFVKTDDFDKRAAELTNSVAH